MTLYSAFGTYGNGATGPASSVTFAPGIIQGMSFEVLSNGCTINGFGYWRADSAASAAPTFVLWNITGAGTGSTVAGTSVSMSGAVTGQWNYVFLPSPVALTNGQEYMAVMGLGATGAGNFSDTHPYFGSGGTASAGINNGPLRVYSDSSGTGTHATNPQDAFTTGTSNPSSGVPTTSNTDYNAWLDVIVATPSPGPPPVMPPRRKPSRAVVQFTPVKTVNAAAAPGVNGTVQPRATIPVPRRVPARAVWAGSRPFTGFAAVAAPRQEPYLPPRRRPARAVVEFTPVTTSNAPPPVSAAPPKPPLSLPRRPLARAVWRGGAGQAFVFVPAPAQGPPRPRSPAPRRAVWRAGPVPGITRPAPRQPPQTVYRRGPARAYVRFTPVVTVNAVGIAVAAPRQLTTIPRRTLARAYVRFTPVTTTNPAFISTAAPAVSTDDKTLVKRRIVWRMLSL